MCIYSKSSMHVQEHMRSSCAGVWPAEEACRGGGGGVTLNSCNSCNCGAWLGPSAAGCCSCNCCCNREPRYEEEECRGRASGDARHAAGARATEACGRGGKAGS